MKHDPTAVHALGISIHQSTDVSEGEVAETSEQISRAQLVIKAH